MRGVMNALSATAATGVDLAAGLAVGVAVARLEGAVGSAPLALGLSVAGMLSVLSFLGAGEAALAAYARPGIDRHSVYAAARTIAARGARRVVVGGLVVGIALGRYWGDVAAIGLGTLALAVSGFGAASQQVAWGAGRAGGDIGRVIAARTLLLGGTAIGLVLGFGAYGALASYVLSNLVLAWLRHLGARRILSESTGGTAVTVEQLVKEGRPIGLATVFGTLAARMDGLVVARLGDATLGQFSAAQRIAAAGLQAGTPFAAAVLPALARAQKNGRAGWPVEARLFLVAGPVLALLMGLAAPLAIPMLYGPGFDAAIPVLQLFSVAMVLQWTNALLARQCIAVGVGSALAHAQGISAAVQVVCKPLGAWGFGVVAIPVVSAVAEAIVLGVYVVALTRSEAPVGVHA